MVKDEVGLDCVLMMIYLGLVKSSLVMKYSLSWINQARHGMQGTL